MASIVQYGPTSQNKDASSLTMGRYSGVYTASDDLVVVCVAGDTAASSVSLGYTEYTYLSHNYTQYEYNAGTNFFAEDFGFQILAGTTRWAYTFTPTDAVDISAFSLFISNITASGNLAISLRRVDVDGLPTGGDLVSVSVACSSLTLNAYNKFTFPSAYSFSAGESFCVYMNGPSNNVTAFKVESHSDEAPRLFKSDDSGSTWVEQNKEPYFYLYAGGVSTVNLSKDVEIAFGTNVTTSIWSGIPAKRSDNNGGGNITVNFAATNAKAAIAYLLKGVTTSGSVFDRSSTGTGTGATPTSGSTAATNQALEALIGAIGTEGDSSDAAGTWVAPLETYGARVGTTGGGAAGNITVHASNAIVSSTGTYAAKKIDITGRDWAAAIATYRFSTGTSITPAALSAATSVVNPFIPVITVITDALASAKASVSGGFRADAWVSPTSISFGASTSYSLYRRVRIGWANIERDFSGTIYLTPLTARTGILNPSVVLGGNIVINLVSQIAYAIASVGQPFIPSLSTYTLRRWNGAQWIDETLMVYQGSWTEKPLYMWIDNEWKSIG